MGLGLGFSGAGEGCIRICKAKNDRSTCPLLLSLLLLLLLLLLLPPLLLPPSSSCHAQMVVQA